MFDLFRSRAKAVRIVLGGILTIVAAAMVITLIPGFGSSSGPTSDDPVLAQIGGDKITSQEAIQTFQRISQQAQISPQMMQVYFPQFLESMVQQRAAVYEAERMGISVSDDEVLVGLMSEFPQFFQNGVLTSKDQLQQYLASQGQTLQQAIDDMHSQLVMHKLQNAVLESVVVSPKEVQDEFNSSHEKAKIQYIAFPAAKFMDQVKPTDEELRKQYDQNKNTYIDPAKTSFQVALLDESKVESTINLTDAQLHEAYSSSLDNFRMPERIHVRHILISTEGKSDAEKAAAKAKAEDLLKQLKNGADFAELAKKNSDDKANAPKGGDLDWVVRGQMVPEFENAAFALKPNEISNVVQTQFGYHIIQLLAKDPAKVKPFEEVKDGLAADLRKQMVNDKMQMLGDQMHDALVKAPASAAEVAKQFGADLITVKDAKQGEAIPNIGSSPEIDGALALMKPNEVSSVVILPMNRLAVAILNSRTPAKPAEFDEVKEQIRQAYVTTMANQLALKAAQGAVDQLKKGGDMEKVAKSLKLDVTTSSYFGRSDSVEGLGSALQIDGVFTKPAGSILGPTMIQGRNVVSKILEKLPADQAAFAAEKDSILLSLKQKKAVDRNSLFLDSIYAKLAADGKVKVFPDAIQRVTASYAQK